MDQDFNLWQKLFQSKPVMRATGGLRYLLGNEQEKNQLSDLWGEDVDNSLPAIMGLTKPFRMGSNILGQYYGSALTGKDMTQQENQGKFLQWLSSALTPEEQTQIEERPYLNALKSSAGMASTLMPFAQAGVVGNVGSKMANPTLSKFTNLLSRGGLEGGVGGFGYSREGKELQDTLLGMGLGAGGEVLGGLISDPTFRRGMGQEIKRANSGNYEAMLKMGDDGVDDIVYDLGFDGNSETIDMYPASNMREDRFKPVGQIHFSVDEGAGIGTIDDIYVDSMYQRKGLATNALKKLKAEYPDIKFTTTLQTDDGSALFNSPEVRKILGTDTGTKPPANIGSLADDADNVIDLTKDRLYLEAKKYDTLEEFIKAQGEPLFHGTSANFDIKDFKGGYLTGNKNYAEVYKNPSASSISYGMEGIKNKQGGKPRVLEFLVDKDAKIFDYQNPKHRALLDDYFGSWSMSGEPSVGKTGQLDWTEGENLAEFFQEKGLDFDGIKLDEGGGFDPETRIELKRAPSVRIINPRVLKTKEALADLWEQAHTQYVGGKLPKNKDRYIKMLTGEEGDENQLHNLDYKGLKKEPGRISKTHEEDLREEMRKTAERWGLYR